MFNFEKHLHSGERVAAAQEEIGVRPDLVNLKNILPDVGYGRFGTAERPT
jgi:hypothetical protein